MPTIILESFKGEIPSIDPKLLPENNAQLAKNCDLRNGKIVPIKQDVVNVSVSSGLATIYLRDGLWRAWSDFTYFFESPISDDTYDRLYQLSTTDFVNGDDFKVEGTGIALRNVALDLPPSALTATATDPPLFGGGKGSIVVEDFNTTPYMVDRDSLASGDGVRLVFNNGSSIVSIGDKVQLLNQVNGIAFDDIYPTFNQTTGIIDSYPYAGDYRYTGSTSDARYQNIVASTTNTYSVINTGTNFIEIPQSAFTFSITDEFPGSYNERWDGSNWVVGGNATQRNTFRRGYILNNLKITVTKGSGSEGDPRDGEILNRYYAWTYVYNTGEESPISDTSNLATIYPLATAELTNIGTASPPTNVTNKRIYTTDSAGTFRFLGEIAGTATTFTDNIANTLLGEELQVNNNPPKMHGVELSPNLFVIGWKDRDLYFSFPELPYAWNENYNIRIKDFNIVRVIATGDFIYVLTEGMPYVLSGFDPSQLDIKQIPEKQACVSKTGVVEYKNSVIYASPDGLFQLKGISSINLVKEFFNKKEWQAINPETAILSVHDDQLHIMTDVKHYVLDLLGKINSLIQTDIVAAEAIHEDIKTDTLYYYKGTNIYEYQGSGINRIAEWQSKDHDFITPISFNSGRVIADDYTSITYDVYADGSLVYTTSVSDSKPFRFSRLKRAKTWSVKVRSSSEISSVQMSTSIKELR